MPPLKTYLNMKKQLSPRWTSQLLITLKEHSECKFEAALFGRTIETRQCTIITRFKHVKQRCCYVIKSTRRKQATPFTKNVQKTKCIERKIQKGKEKIFNKFFFLSITKNKIYFYPVKATPMLQNRPSLVNVPEKALFRSPYSRSNSLKKRF